MCGSVVVVSAGGAGPPLSPLEKGPGFVVAGWGQYTIVGLYFSPNRTLAEFEDFLDSVSEAVRRHNGGRTLVLGDFNAKSQAWGSPTSDGRGRAVLVWAVHLGLSLLNRGTVHTCVRAQGGSIVDLSFASPSVADRVANWRVEDGVETLSDHNYVRFEVSTSPVVAMAPPQGPNRLPRWCLTQMDRELVKEASIIVRWASSGDERDTSVGERAEQLRADLTEVCDSAMPRARGWRRRKRVYWWSDEIAVLRIASHRARRDYVRCRRRNGLDVVLEEQLREVYGQAKRALQLAISCAKERAREELLEGLSRDPWGRPYRVARRKLRNQGPPVTQTLQPELLRSVVEGLFPDSQGHVPPTMSSPVPQAGRGSIPLADSGSVPLITGEEMDVALGRLRSKKTAPGPDGIPGRVIYMTREFLEARLRELFNQCILAGQFPKSWKEGLLCLIRKAGRPLDAPSAYRPIVLLNEVGKVFEKILADRLVGHLETVGPGLSAEQYGFRAGRSTIDALESLKALTDEAVAGGDVILAVSLDVTNAFNSLPFETLLEALRYHEVPPYLRRLLESYLQDRWISWTGSGGQRERRKVLNGVPQGSVLGPVLWNIGFDWLLRAPMLPGTRVLCYADDTLVTARGSTFAEASRLATVSASLVARRVQALGLRVSVPKTEALLFHGPRRGPPRGAQITVQGVQVEIKAQMKYLGLTLDGRWSFKGHFELLAPRLVGAAAALGRLLPNIGGPDSACRRLYAGIVRSMALYGAPIWVHALSPQNITLLRRPQRVIAVRAIRGYRTVSWTASTLLAGDPPWDLQAEVLAQVHRYRSSVRTRGERPGPEEIGRLRTLGREVLVQRWREDLESPVAGIWTVEGIRPHLERWLKRRHGALTYRLVQVLTGHGCFGKYLHGIARR
ncbi:jg25023, partial [Pararge aegeria aegeria]